MFEEEMAPYENLSTVWLAKAKASPVASVDAMSAGHAVKHLCNMIRSLEADLAYWKSRTKALEVERKTILGEAGIDLGERPSLPEPK